MIEESKRFKISSLPINILISIGLITIPILTSPDLGLGFELFTVPPFIRNFISYLILTCFFYLSYYFIIPNYYFSKKWLLLAVFVLLGYVMVIKLPQFIILESPREHFDQHHMGFNRGNSNPFFRFFLSRDNHLFQFMGVFLLSLFLRVNEHLNDIKNKKLRAEISYLKSQINPHFLFNTLNSLYALALTNSEKTPETILKLSNLMRYVVMESNQMYVLLDKEINYVKNFIDLQRLRISDSTNLTTRFKGDFKNHKITPLILISLIENAFKYGADVDDESKILLDVTIENNVLKVIVKNTIANAVNVKAQQSSNKGLKNTKKQLSIFYPNKNSLKIKKESDYFKVKLNIKL